MSSPEDEIWSEFEAATNTPQDEIPTDPLDFITAPETPILLPPVTPPPKVDRWAHRRAEPRPLALVWILYLFAATILLLAVRTQGVADSLVYRSAAVMLVVTVGVGIALLWPMLRLSQSLPPTSLKRAALEDALVIVIPVHAVVWPLVWLAHWPIQVVGAITLLLTLYGLLTGGLLSIAYHRIQSHPTTNRTLWMLGFAAMAILPGLFAGIRWWAGFGKGAIEGWPAMLSPVTLVFAVTREVEWAGPMARTPTAAWTVAAVMCLAAAAAWTLAKGLARGERRPTSLH